MQSSQSQSEHAVADQLVVPIDLTHDSWGVLPFAEEFGQALGVAVRTVHVDVSSRPDQVAAADAVVVRADVGDRPVRIEILPGRDVTTALQQFVEDHPRSLVVMSTHGRSGANQLVRGNTCRDLLDRIDRPVLAVGPQFDPVRHASLRRVVACIDPAAPNHRLTAECARLANALSVPLVVLCVRGEVLSRPSDQERDAALESALFNLSPIAAGVTVEVVDGRQPGEAIVEFADQIPGTLLGLVPDVSHQHHVTAKSVSMYVARESRTPLLLLSAVAQHVRVDSRTATCHDEYDPVPKHDIAPMPSRATGCHDDYGLGWA